MLKTIIAKILLTCLVIAGLDTFFQYQIVIRHHSRAVLETSYHLAEVRRQIEENLIYNLLLAKGAASFVAIDAESISQEKFAQYARLMLEESKAIRNIGLAKGYIIEQVYPRAGNERALGLDYRKLPRQFPKVAQAAHSGSLVIDGPLQLVQGGIGIIGRAPVMLEGENNHKKFWGIVSTVIDIDQLLAEIDVQAPELAVAIRNSSNQEVFWCDPQLFFPQVAATLMKLPFPGGEWELAGLPQTLPSSHLQLPLTKPVHALSFLLLLLLCIGYLRAYKSEHILLRTRENLRHAQAIAHLGDWKLDFATKEIWWSEECFRIFGLTPSSTAPSMDEVMAMIHPEDVETVLAQLAITEEEGTPYALDHRILLGKGRVCYVQARGELQFNKKGTPVALHGTVLDITERKEVELELQASEEMNNAMVTASLDAFVTLNTDDQILFWSPAAERMFGWSKEEAVGQKMHQLIVPERYRARAYAGLKHFAENGTGPFIGIPQEVIALRKDGTEFPADLSVAPFELNSIFYAQGSIRDASQRKENEQWLKHLATTDELTGLKNRRYFLERSAEEIKRSKRYQLPLALIMFDIDHFKSINDTYGHEVGDLVLKQLAEILKSLLREQDVLGRHGGEEFTVLLPHTAQQGAWQTAERIRLGIENNMLQLEDGRTIKFTVSLGIAELGEQTATLDSLLNAADHALYRAKNEGRNKAVLA